MAAVLLLTVCVLCALMSLSLMLLRSAWETLSFYWLTPRRIKRIMEKQGIRGPPPSFLVGNLNQVSSLINDATEKDMDSIHHDIVSRILPHYTLWSKQYGKRFIFWSGSEPRLCLPEIEIIKEFLSAKYTSFTGKSWLQKQGNKHFVGRGLLMANGNDWYHQRHILAPVFLPDKLKSHVGYMVECTKQMLSSLEKVLESGEDEVEIGDYLTKLTGDIIARTEFDSSYEKGKRIFDLLTSLQMCVAKSSRYFILPGSRFFPNKFNIEIKKLKKEVETLLMEIIQSRKDCVEIGRSVSFGTDLLGLLLTEMQKKREGFNFDLQYLMDECKTFFFTGHETTALLLTWTVMLLAINPSWQEKARKEVRQVFGDQMPSSDQLSKLPLMNMILNESMRLYPPASILPRMVFEDIKIGDLFIPKGLSVWIPALAIHHSEDLWGKDAHEFKPDRFAGKSFTSGRHFMPFCAGPRNCIGQSFALMEAKIILSMFLSRFRFSISKSYRHAPISVLTLRPKHGVQIILKPVDHEEP